MAFPPTVSCENPHPTDDDDDTFRAIKGRRRICLLLTSHKQKRQMGYRLGPAPLLVHEAQTPREGSIPVEEVAGLVAGPGSGWGRPVVVGAAAAGREEQTASQVVPFRGRPGFSVQTPLPGELLQSVASVAVARPAAGEGSAELERNGIQRPPSASWSAPPERRGEEEPSGLLLLLLLGLVRPLVQGEGAAGIAGSAGILRLPVTAVPAPGLRPRPSAARLLVQGIEGLLGCLGFLVALLLLLRMIPSG